MKQRKNKPNQPKRIAIINHEDASVCADTTNKLPSAHTKMSTNYTIHSTAHNSQSFPAKKTKKANGRSSKDSPSTANQGLPNSKSSKRLKINLGQESIKANQSQISYRQYCLVDQNFIPVTNPNEIKRIDDFLSHTASTCDFSCNPQTPTVQTKTKQLRKRSVSSLKIQEVGAQVSVQKVDHSTSVKEQAVMQCDKQVSVLPECCEIGLQYSQRFFNQTNQLEKDIIETKISTQIHENQSLSELLFKLEFSHLADQKSFTNLTFNQKQHFTQLLETLVGKLKPKPQIKPINFSTDNLQEPSQSYRHPNQKLEEERRAQLEELYHLIDLRQQRQMNWIEVAIEGEGEQQVNTSLFAVINFLCHLFCFVEVQYSDQFIYMIQKFYGHTYRQRYRRITRNIPIVPDRKFRVIQESIFLDFINQSGTYSNPNQIVHLKAVFDAFNQHLQEYRPFYHGNGQQFPWALKFLISLSQYSINQDSMQIIFLQAKQKMIEWCSGLCGLIIDNPLPVLPGNPLQTKHNERQERMVRTWLKEQNFQKDGMQLYCTQVLHNISEIIYQDLIEECINNFLLI